LNDFRFERGYTLLAWVFKYILGLRYAEFYLALVSTSLGIKLRLIWKYTSSPIFATMVYAFLFYPLHEYTQIRVAVALGFAYLALHHGLQKKLRKTIIFIFLALTFHYSLAIVFIVAGIFFFFRHNKILFFFATIAVFILLAIGSLQKLPYFLNELNPLTSAYLENVSDVVKPNLFSGSNILYCMILLSSAYLFKPWRKESSFLWFFLAIMGLSSFAILLDYPVFAHRIKEIFMFSTVFLTFQFKLLSTRAVPAFLMLLNGIWVLNAFVSQGLLK